MDKVERFTELYTAAEPKLRLAFTSFAFNRDDLYQESLIHLWNKFDSFDGDKQFLPWARNVMKNKALDIIRASNETNNVLYNEWEHVFEETQTAPVILKYRKELDKVYRSGLISSQELVLLSRRYAAGMSSAQLAKIGNTTPEAIRQQLSRLKKRINDYVDGTT